MNPLSIRGKEVVNAQLAKGDTLSGIKVVFKELVTNYHNGQSWIFDPAISGGGVLIDSGVNAISVVEYVCGKVEPVEVELTSAPGYKVETSTKVTFTGAKNPSFRGELVQDWLWPGEESREFTITFGSGATISFCFAKGSITTTTPDGKHNTEQVISKQQADVHLTPMSLEYINVINFAVDGFEKAEYVDELGEGPFEFVMKCYEKTKTKH